MSAGLIAEPWQLNTEQAWRVVRESEAAGH
jgi:hypothetical protein